MEISYSWLKDYIQFEESPEQLAEILTNLGLEVSSVTKFQSIEGGLEDLFVGEVVSCIPHPNSDHLSLTKVNIGSSNLLDIVCGAPNVAKGQKVVVATVGATLYGMAEPLTIKKSKIRGELSEGMICAEDEIGIGKSHAGIMVLPEDTPVGMKAAALFGIETDYVLEVDITPNRIDSASHFGVARDLAAFFAKTREVVCRLPEVPQLPYPSTPSEITVHIENIEACPRYMGLYIKNVSISPSPQWLQNRLKAIGLKPINNVVDISNYVMFETGQPLHMFDAEKISGGKVIIKTLPENTNFVTLDGIERKLSCNDLMICNSSEGMCIAGVFGGMDAGISDTTKNVFIESAYFNPSWVRRTAKRHAISTDSSFRFERGADPNMAPYALKRAADLVVQLAGGKIASDIIDQYPQPITPVTVNCLYKHFERLCGVELTKELIHSILKSLEIEITSVNESGFSAIVPTYRVDVTREADIIEDFLRVYGYNNVTLPSKMVSSLTFTQKPDRTAIEANIAEMLTGRGFSEIMCTSFTRKRYFELFPDKKPVVEIHNALSNELNCMRPTLLFGGLESIARNISFQQNDILIYELGRRYTFNPDKDPVPGKGYCETNTIAIWMTGNLFNGGWNTSAIKTDFFTVKAVTNMVLQRIGITPDDITADDFTDNKFETALRYTINGLEIAEFGIIDRKVLKETDIAQSVYYSEMNTDNALKIIKNRRTKAEPLPRYPKVKRDLALLIDEDIKYSSIRDLALRTERKILRKVELFDVYKGKGIPEGKKSYALSFILQDSEKTLNDKEIEKVMQKLMAAFIRELQAQVR
ncbi:MAG: phenylalanine--tRNA ligase subunit beta [Bacteroidales bacterium]|nr:phenylalanine--tRNA ligase subunit beta [Bacteroidales bacterium]HQP04529.1 phenylalanine--tRNA ligase subunit beta [Bacteroidales bacterium]